MHKATQLFSLVVFITACSQAKEQPQQQNAANAVTRKPLEYYTYGLPEPYYERAEETVFAKYGVVIKRVAGCVVNDSLIQDVKAHNDSLFAALSKKYRGLNEDQVLQEMQQYVTTTKSIEATIQRTLKRKLAAINPNFYTFINFKEDSTKGQYVVDFYANRNEIERADTLLWQLKVTPATDYILIKNKEGQWDECIK